MRLLDSNGGIICYSTCSLNPIENEAVVNAAIKIANSGREGKCFEIIDLHSKGKKYPFFFTIKN